MGNLVSSARARFDPLRSLAFGGISAVYAAVGLPFANPVRLLKITNTTDRNLLISVNGIDAYDIIVSNSYCLYDVGINKAEAAGLLEISAGDRIYVRSEAVDPASGNVYVTVLYAAQK